MAELLLDEVDRLARGQPERRGRGEGRAAGPFGGGASLSAESWPPSADVVSVEHQAFGLRKDELVEPLDRGLILSVVTQNSRRYASGLHLVTMPRGNYPLA